jgi:hypothetical protein
MNYPNANANNMNYGNKSNNFSGNNSRKNRRNNAVIMRKNSRKNRRNNGMNDMTRKQRGGKRGSVVGSRIQVMHGTCHHTAGGLTKGDLMMHKGRIVSRKAHAAGKKAIQRLRKAGYVAKKGHFKLFTKKH